MPRISGVDLPVQKKVVQALQSIYGVGPKRAKQLVTRAKIDESKRARDLTNTEIATIQKLLEEYPTEGDLRRLIRDNIDRLKRVRSYRGMRHSANLPVRGQRTRVNARTNRGKRKTVGAMTKEMAAKVESSKG